MKKVAEHWREQGFRLDFSELLYIAERNEAGTYLAGHGWQVSTTTLNELLVGHGFTPFDADEPMVRL